MATTVVTQNNLEEIIIEVKNKSLNFLAHKARTEKEVSGRIDYYLKRYEEIDEGVKKDIRGEIVEDYKKNGLLDDRIYAETFVKEKINSPKPTSKLKIKQFLGKKGVKSDLIEEMLALFTEDVELQKITEDAKKKLSQIRETNSLKVKKKLTDYLARKGYPYSKIYTVVDSVCNVK